MQHPPIFLKTREREPHIDTMNPSIFHIFNQLPSELRIKIWKHSLPDHPRVISVRYNRTTNQYTSTSAPHSMLHVCNESRTIFLSFYTKLILSPKYDSCVFVDFKQDTIFFDTLDCSPDGDLSLDIQQSPHRDLIQSCAIDSQLWEVLRVFKYDPMSEVRWMRNLSTIALVMNREFDLGIHHRPLDDDGSNFFVEVESNTVGSEIRHVHWYVESLRWELKHGLEKYWGDTPPTIQMWLW